MNRRDALRYLALAAGGAFGARLAEAAVQGHLHGHGSRGSASKAFASRLEPQQRAMLATLSELIIPETDTPGAIRAGVPAFMDEIISTWLTDAERSAFLGGLAQIDAFCRTRFGRGFMDCQSRQHTAALADAEREAGSFHPGPIDTVNDAIGGATPFFTRLKALTVLGYYTSEIGATQELSYNPIPAAYHGDYDFPSAGRQWSS